MTSWLSPEWFDRARALAEEEPARPGLSARVQWEVTGGPNGDLRYYWVLSDGRPTEGAEGTVARPDVTLTMAWDAAAAVQRGDLDPNVAFMRGQMKVAGSMGVMLALLPVATSPAGRDLRRRIADLTDF